MPNLRVVGEPVVAVVADRPSASRPKSATGLLTGASGAVAAIAATLLLRDWLQPNYVKTLAVSPASSAAGGI